MATGIEMLGQMGTDQSLAGPVQGGNMVVKPNRVPVGGATMLSKALRKQADKGVGGMYLLPEQEDQTPDFMKIAKSNVMRDIQGQRNQYPMNYAKNEGGIIPMLPRNLKTRPGADETTLAYITPEEQAVLGLLNPGTPHSGPEQVPTYDSYDYGTYTSSEDWSDYDTGGDAPEAYTEARQEAAQDTGSQYHQQAVQEIAQEEAQGGGRMQDYADSYKDVDVSGITETTEVTDSQENDRQKLVDAINKDDKETAQKIIEANKDNQNFFAGLVGDGTGMIKGLLDFTGITKLKDWGSNILFKDGEKKTRTTGEFIDDLFTGGAFGGIMKALSIPTEKHFKDNNYLAVMQDKYLNTDGSIKEGMEEDFKRFSKDYSDLIPKGGAGKDFSMKETLMSGKIEEDSDLERRLKPEKYWSKNKPATGQDFKDMAQAQREGKLAFTKANTQAIEEGRRLLERESGGGGRRPGGMGGGAGPVIEDEVIEGVVEEGATTMPYTGSRTGGAEVNVPLSRRFALDPTQEVAQYRTAPRSAEDIYKYYTEGTEGEGLSLEPYSEFQKRRRKALGREPLDFYSY